MNNIQARAYEVEGTMHKILGLFSKNANELFTVSEKNALGVAFACMFIVAIIIAIMYFFKISEESSKQNKIIGCCFAYLGLGFLCMSVILWFLPNWHSGITPITSVLVVLFGPAAVAIGAAVVILLIISSESKNRNRRDDDDKPKGAGFYMNSIEAAQNGALNQMDGDDGGSGYYM